MPRRDRTEPGAARSPLVDLEAELRALDRKRQAHRGAERERRVEPLRRITPGSWGDVERTA